MIVNVKGMTVDLSRAQWRSASNPSGNCVEAAFVGEAVAVRDSKDPTGPALIFTGPEWDTFVAGVRDGRFDRSE